MPVSSKTNTADETVRVLALQVISFLVTVAEDRASVAPTGPLAAPADDGEPGGGAAAATANGGVDAAPPSTPVKGSSPDTPTHPLLYAPTAIKTPVKSPPKAAGSGVGDADGLSDGQEVKTCGTNPLKTDTDGDGVNDYDEVKLGSDPKSRAR